MLVLRGYNFPTPIQQGCRLEVKIYGTAQAVMAARRLQ